MTAGGRISTTNEHVDARVSEGDFDARRLVLVADDETILLRSLSMMLRGAGFATLEATDGAMALELVRTRGAEISVALLDVSMPLMGGVEAAVEIRRLRPDLPIVLMSGGTQDDLVGVEVVMKPFDPEVLVQILQRVANAASSAGVRA